MLADMSQYRWRAETITFEVNINTVVGIGEGQHVCCRPKWHGCRGCLNVEQKHVSTLLDILCSFNLSCNCIHVTCFYFIGMFWYKLAFRSLIFVLELLVIVSLIIIFTNMGFTHWDRLTHICVSELTFFGSDNGLSSGRRQAIIWTNAGILLIRPLGTKFSEVLIKIHIFSVKKINLRRSSGNWRPFCLGPQCANRCAYIWRPPIYNQATAP